MTSIQPFVQRFQAEDRSWIVSEYEDAYTRGGTLDLTTFTPAVHFTNGYLPSGTAVGVITASNKLGPYDSTASDGRQTCVGLTHGAVRVIEQNGQALTVIGVAFVAAFAAIALGRLPFNTTNATTARGYIDAAAQTALRNLYFQA
jgi:hypothetical protein